MPYHPKQKITINPLLNVLDIARAGKTLLWVDDKPNEENEFIASTAEEQGVTVIRATSTAEGLSKFDELGETKHFPQSNFRIMTNMRRVEGGQRNPNAGLEFAQQVRQKQYTGPILVFCGQYLEAKQALEKEHLVSITDDTAFAISYACFNQVLVTIGAFPRPPGPPTGRRAAGQARKALS